MFPKHDLMRKIQKKCVQNWYFGIVRTMLYDYALIVFLINSAKVFVCTYYILQANYCANLNSISRWLSTSSRSIYQNVFENSESGSAC